MLSSVSLKSLSTYLESLPIKEKTCCTREVALKVLKGLALVFAVTAAVTGISLGVSIAITHISASTIPYLVFAFLGCSAIALVGAAISDISAAGGSP